MELALAECRLVLRKSRLVMIEPRKLVCMSSIKQSIDMEKKRKFIGKLIEKFEWFVHG